MTTEANLASATQQIRRRLLMLLLRAYVITLAVSLLLFAVLLAGLIGLAQQGPLFRELLNSTLASYYIGAGSWDNVAALEVQLPQNRDVSELVRGLEILDLDRTVVYSTKAAEIANQDFTNLAASKTRSPGQLLALGADDLEKVDIGLMNLLCAEGLEGAQRISIYMVISNN